MNLNLIPSLELSMSNRSNTSIQKMRFPEFENNIPNMSSTEYAQFLTLIIQLVNTGSLTPKTATNLIISYNDPNVREVKDHISNLPKDVFKKITQRLDPIDVVSFKLASKTINNRFIKQNMLNRLPLFEKVIIEIFNLIKLINLKSFKYIISCKIALSPTVYLKINSDSTQLYIEEVKVTLKNINNKTTRISQIDRVKIETNSGTIQSRYKRAKRIASILNQNISFNNVNNLKKNSLFKTEILIYADQGETVLFEHFGSSFIPVVFSQEVKAIDNLHFKNAIRHLEAIFKNVCDALNIPTKEVPFRTSADNIVFNIEQFRLFEEDEIYASTSVAPHGGSVTKNLHKRKL